MSDNKVNSDKENQITVARNVMAKWRSVLKSLAAN